MFVSSSITEVRPEHGRPRPRPWRCVSAVMAGTWHPTCAKKRTAGVGVVLVVHMCGCQSHTCEPHLAPAYVTLTLPSTLHQACWVESQCLQLWPRSWCCCSGGGGRRKGATPAGGPVTSQDRCALFQCKSSCTTLQNASSPTSCRRSGPLTLRTARLLLFLASASAGLPVCAVFRCSIGVIPHTCVPRLQSYIIHSRVHATMACLRRPAC